MSCHKNREKFHISLLFKVCNTRACGYDGGDCRPPPTTRPTTRRPRPTPRSCARGYPASHCPSKSGDGNCNPVSFLKQRTEDISLINILIFVRNVTPPPADLMVETVVALHLRPQVICHQKTATTDTAGSKVNNHSNSNRTTSLPT